MRNAKLTILAALSLAMLAVLAWGYVGSLGFAITYVSVTSSGKMLRVPFVDVSRGQLTVASERFTNPQPIAQSPGLRIYPQIRFKPAEPARDCLWRFHVGRSSPQMGFIWAGLICPIWFAALPYTIAPIAWLRRRRRRETRGFAVEGRQASEPASEAGKVPSL